ncbi:hypothetical protein QL285_082922 [Trifolium repens]|nr:hypothetical protein QL285_082922 [Trifolium repens]
MKRLCPAQHHSLPSTNTAAIVVSSSAIEIETSPPTNPASPPIIKECFSVLINFKKWDILKCKAYSLYCHRYRLHRRRNLKHKVHTLLVPINVPFQSKNLQFEFEKREWRRQVGETTQERWKIVSTATKICFYMEMEI